LRLFTKILLVLLCCVLVKINAQAQFILSGTVLDYSKINYVPNVKVISTGGLFTFTDSLGKYKIMVTEKDSLTFFFTNKPTQKFVVKNINDISHFDVSLHININTKYNTLKEVIVFSKSHRQDSLENRATYADIFNYNKPTFRTSIGPSGVVGADANELINIFRFKRNKRLKAFRTRLEIEEQDKYVNYRFSKKVVKRITQLKDNNLERFMILYKPDYDFVSIADELTFNQYLLNCLYNFKIMLLQEDAKK
jgi:hypothetical protein